MSEPLLLLEDSKRSVTELRFHALGLTNSGRQLHITFTLRQNGALIRVISARGMSDGEREFYGESA